MSDVDAPTDQEKVQIWLAAGVLCCHAEADAVYAVALIRSRADELGVAVAEVAAYVAHHGRMP